MGFTCVISANSRTANLSGDVRYVGIQSIEQTVVSEENGGVNVLTITLTNGNTQTFEVRNGTAQIEVDTTLEQSGKAADAKAVGDRLAAMESDIADLQYEPISITAFGHDAGARELGEVVEAVVLNWGTNKTPVALELDGQAIDADLTSKALEGLSLTGTTTWTLKATDERRAVAEKSATLSFLNGVYYGAGAAPAALDSAFILGLTKTLTSTRKRTVTVDAGQGEYIWYAVPVRLGKCTFKVGGFEGGFDLVAEQDFTNALGYTEPYYIYRSGQAGLGSTTVEVS